MKKVFTHIVVIVVIINLLMQTLVPASYAADTDGGFINEEQEKAVAEYTQKFVKEGNDKQILIYSQNRYDRIKGYNFEVTSNEYGQYNGKQNNGAPFTNMLVYDSASFIATMYNRTLYMQLSANANSRDNVYTIESFLEDARNSGYFNNFGFIEGDRTYSCDEILSMAESGRIKPGDVLIYADGKHMLMYIGKNEDLLYEDFKMTEAEVETLDKHGNVTGEKIIIDLPDPHYYIHASNTVDNITVSALELLPYVDEIAKYVREDLKFYVIRPKKGDSNPITDDMKVDMDIVWPDNTYSAYTKVGKDPITGREYEYYYVGTPDTADYSLGVETRDLYKWLGETIEDFVSWLAGFITMGLRILLVGWASAIEKIISDAVQAVGEVQRPTTKTVNGNEYEYASSRILNIEDIVYNRVPLLDANIFNYTVAGTGFGSRKTDEEIDELRQRAKQGNPEAIKELQEYLHSVLSTMAEPEFTDLEYEALQNDDNAWERLKEYRETENALITIRRTVANFYLLMRNIAAIGLLLTLIYIGIRMAISSIAGERAKYKKILVNWCVSALILFIMEYIMIFILQINQTFVNMLSTSNDGVSFYETFKTMAYEVKFLDGWVGAIIYVVLLVYLMKFLWIYIKRFFTICILTILAPIISIGYSIDKIKDNKSQSLSRWVKNYVFNVIIQFVHAGLYSILMSIVYGLLKGEANFAAALLAFIFLNFISSAPKIVENIFAIKAPTLKDTLEDIGTQFATFAAITGLVKLQAKVYSRPLKAMGWAGSKVANTIRYGHYKPFDYSALYDIEDEDERNKKIKEAQEREEALKKDREEKIKVDIARRKEVRDTQFRYAKDVLNSGKAIVYSMAAVPSMVLSPKAGMAMLLTARNTHNKAKQDIQKIQSKALGYDVDKYKRKIFYE